MMQVPDAPPTPSLLVMKVPDAGTLPTPSRDGGELPEFPRSYTVTSSTASAHYTVIPSTYNAAEYVCDWPRQDVVVARLPLGTGRIFPGR